MRKEQGFTLVELLIAMAIAVIIAGGFLAAGMLMIRGTNSTNQKIQIQYEFDRTCHDIYNLLINTDKSHINQIITTSPAPDAIGTGIIFQIPTIDTNGSFTTSSGILVWGDGQTKNHYIRIRQDENNDVVMEKITSLSGPTIVEKKILIKDCSMQIRGAFINNSGALEYNNATPSILDISFEKQDKYFTNQKYKKHIHITLRVH